MEANDQAEKTIGQEKPIEDETQFEDKIVGIYAPDPNWENKAREGDEARKAVFVPPAPRKKKKA